MQHALTLLTLCFSHRNRSRPYCYRVIRYIGCNCIVRQYQRSVSDNVVPNIRPLTNAHNTHVSEFNKENARTVVDISIHDVVEVETAEIEVCGFWEISVFRRHM